MADRETTDLRSLIPKLRRKIRRFREAERSIGEENTKATLVEPLLAALGWDTEEPEEVHREYRKKPQDSPVDYALCVRRAPKLFVEAKSLEKNVGDRKWASQVMGYASTVGVEWCVLTNGDEYRLYNAHAAVDVEEKLFRSVKISDDSQIPLLLDTLDLLSNQRLRERRLTTLWEAHHVDRQVKEVIEALWEGPDSSFVRLIRKHAKGLGTKDVQASLLRSRIRMDFPVEGKAPTESRQPKKPRTRPNAPGQPRQVSGLPAQSEIAVPLLREILQAGGQIDTRMQLDAVAESLADQFSLTPSQRSALTKTGKSTVWKNRIQWLRLALVKRGDLESGPRGVWRLSEQGSARARSAGTGKLRLVEGEQ